MRHLPASPALLLVLGACQVHLDHGHGQAQVTHELEPNDAAAQAHDLGWLAPGDSWTITGDWCDPSCDPFDGFAFRASEALFVRLELAVADPQSAAALCVFDPALDAFVLSTPSPSSLLALEFAVTNAGADFHVVVQPAWGAAPYTLRVEARAALGPSAAVAPKALAPDGARDRYAAAPELQDPAPTPIPVQLVLRDREGRIELGPLGLLDEQGRLQLLP